MTYEWVQNIPLWHKDHFELKAFENQQMREEAFSTLSVYAKKQRLPKKVKCYQSPFKGGFPYQV